MAITTSKETQAYKKKLQQLESSQPADYTYKNQSLQDSVLNQLLNRKSFSYDFNADPLYQQYKDQYTKLGSEAAQNAAADASALTGGYGSSYATTAASQANQQYLSQLNDVIPELYNAAMEKSQNDLNELTTKYSVLSNDNDTQYNRYRNSVDDYYTNRSYYNTAYQNALSNDYTQANYDESKREFDLNYALNKASAEASEKAAAAAADDEDTFDPTEYVNNIVNMASYNGSGAGINTKAAAKNYVVGLEQKGTINEDEAVSIYRRAMAELGVTVSTADAKAYLGYSS